MEDQYGMADLRQYIGTRPNFFPPPPDLLSSHRGLSQPAQHPYDMLVFRSDSSNSTAPTTAINNIAGSSVAGAAAGFGCFESGLSFGGGDGGAGRWPRQETLTLLEIRSRLDPKFKEANQKGPLWDEVSRIMSEEHRYQRSGKKCREKFENLYKYYKKTKEGKAGRQDGKHYRFFRQLEALYGEANNNNNNNNNNNSEAHLHHHHHHHMIGTSTTFDHYMNYKEPFQGATPKFSDNTSLSLSNYSEADTTSSDDTDLINEGTTDDNNNEANKSKKRSGKTDWKVKIKDMVDLQMKKLMDKQEAWMEKMMTTMEHKERERMMREEEWRKQDAARIESEHKYWASERAWIEARDAALMEALHKLTGKELMAAADIYRNGNSNHETVTTQTVVKGEIWPENDEISRLVELKRGMDGAAGKDEQRAGGCLSENVFWDEKMSCFGHDKKIKENTKRCSYYNHVSNQLGGGEEGVYCSEQGVEPVMRLNNSSPNNNNNAISDQSCFRYFMGDGYGRI